MKQFFAWCIAAALAISLRGCGQEAARRPVEEIPATPQIQTGMIAEQILPGADGDIHYSYFLPESYDGRRTYPLVMVMPGYDMMWFGEDSSGSNLDWNGFLSWTQLDTEMIVVSAQLTDWHEKSARQAIELTEYFIDHFA
ncbi:MAG: alpha/beta hydrolase, partial [Christensenellales bacterium]